MRTQKPKTASKPKRTKPKKKQGCFWAAILGGAENKSRRFLLMTADKGVAVIRGFKSREAGLSFFSTSYDRAHARGYESSMSACINFIEFNPRIVQFDDLDHVKSCLKKPVRLQSLSSISGYYEVLELNAKGAALYKDGACPRLI